MDLWAAVLRRLGAPSLGLAILGRRVGHLPRGRFVHEGIARTPPVRGERLPGWPAHHAIASTFAALLLVVLAPDAAPSPTLPAALAVGRGTIVAPSFLLQPGLAMSRKARRPGFDSAKSLATHTVLGPGSFLAARGTAPLLAVHP